MKLKLLGGAGALLVAASAIAGSYDLQVTVAYAFGVVSSTGNGAAASPDSGYVDIVNLSGDPFSGTIGLGGLSAFAGPEFDVTSAGLAASGGSVRLVPSPESSNVGGYNGPFGSLQQGMLLSIRGMVGDCPIDFKIHDYEIHSGVPRLNPYGVLLDNYILQGGDPFGRDTGDAYEVTQAPAVFHIAGNCNVPEGANTLGLLSGALGTLALLRRKTAA